MYLKPSVAESNRREHPTLKNGVKTAGIGNHAVSVHEYLINIFRDLLLLYKSSLTLKIVFSPVFNITPDNDYRTAIQRSTVHNIAALFIVIHLAFFNMQTN